MFIVVLDAVLCFGGYIKKGEHNEVLEKEILQRG